MWSVLLSSSEVIFFQERFTALLFLIRVESSHHWRPLFVNVHSLSLTDCYSVLLFFF